MYADHKAYALHLLLQLKLNIQYSPEVNKDETLQSIQQIIQTLTRREELPELRS